MTLLRLRRPLAALVLLLSIAGPHAPAHAESEAVSSLRADAEEAMDAKRYGDAAKKLEAALILAHADGTADAQLDDILPELVKAYYAQGNLKQAFERQRDYLDRVLARDEPAVSADAAVTTAVLAAKLKLFKEAERQLDFAEVLYTEAQNKPALAKVAFYKAIAAQGRHEYARTVKEYERARQLALDAGSPEDAARRLLDLGNVYKEFLSQYDLALKHYDKAIAEFEALGMKDAVLDARIDKGNTLVELGEIKASVALLSKTQALISPKRSPVSWIRASQMLAKAHYRSGAYYDVEALLGRIFQALPEVENPQARGALEIDALNLRAMLAAELGRYPAAFQDFDAAVRRARELDLPAKEAFLRNNMGYWLREMGKAKEALAEHERALALDKELKSPDGIAFDLRNLGLTKTETGDYDQALALLTEALELSLQVGGAFNIAYTRLGLGDVHLKKGNWQAALAQFNEAVRIADEHDLTAFAWQAHAGLAIAALQQGDLELARVHFQRSVTLIEQIEAALRSDEARKDFKTSPKVQRVFRHFETLLRQLGRDRDADALLKRAKPQLAGSLPTI